MWSVIRKKQNKKGEEGFTLIELIVVIAILGFLLAIAIPRYNTARAKAAVNASAANLKNLANAMELYVTEHNIADYPSNGLDIVALYMPSGSPKTQQVKTILLVEVELDTNLPIQIHILLLMLTLVHYM